MTRRQELLIAAIALLGLLGAQLVLSFAIRGSNYYGVDGKMAQAIALATLEFAACST